jgi:peptidylprolyl isomerase
MKRVITVLLAVLALQATAQDKGKATDKKSKDSPKIESKKVKKPKTVKTASGLEYTITEKGNGKKPQKGDKISVHYTGKLTNDTVFDSSVKRGIPFEFRVGEGMVVKGWDEAFLLLQEGDKATIKFGPALGYGETDNGPIPANSTLIFDVEFLKIVQEAIQPLVIAAKDTITTPSGLKYAIVKPNKSGETTKGKKVTVNYTGFLKDGKMFDSSLDRNQPLVVDIGKGKLFPGLDEAIGLMCKGEKGRFIIPAHLAFGEKGGGPVPPNTDIIMDLEVVEVKEIPVPVKYDTTGIAPKTTASGLKYFAIQSNPAAKQAQAGQTVKVHYTGYLADGKMFDSSVERGEPIEFPLGGGNVIPGWEEGIALMHVGDKFRLIIPYHLAYGEQGRAPVIPPKAELTFDVELVAAEPAPPAPPAHQHTPGESH